MTNFPIFQIAELQKELHEYKEKWASTQCDLQDAQESLASTEAERTKTIACLKTTIEALDQQRDENTVIKTELAEIKSRMASKSFTQMVRILIPFNPNTL